MRQMSHTQVRQARQYLEEQRRLWPPFLKKVEREDWPAFPDGYRVPAEVMRSRDFLVQLFEEAADIIRMSVCRCQIKDDGSWSDNITWDELQMLKSECGLGLFDAVEIFPAHDDVVNVANMRHLWVLPKPLSFAWRKQRIITSSQMPGTPVPASA